MKNIKKLELPPMPRSFSGLRNDGKPDKRFKRGETAQEIERQLENISGTSEVVLSEPHSLKVKVDGFDTFCLICIGIIVFGVGVFVGMTI